MELFLQILGAIFLVLLIVVGAVILFFWWQFRKLRRELTEAAAGLKRTAQAIGPIVLPREFYDPDAASRRLIESREVSPGGFAPEDEPVLDGAVGEGLIRPDERGWAVLVRDRAEDVDRLASILELDDAPIFDPPDNRSGVDVLREGPVREAFSKLNAMRSEGDRFGLRGTIDDVDVYIHGE